LSALGKAAAKFEAAFTSLAPEVRQAVMLAMYRAAPAIAQYQRDLAPLTDSEEIADAVWDIMIAGALRLTLKGREGIGARQLDEMKEKAPQTFDFLVTTGRLIEGMLPGMQPAPAALPPVAKKLLEPPAGAPPALPKLIDIKALEAKKT
jgi:hypothetical protein